MKPEQPTSQFRISSVDTDAASTSGLWRTYLEAEAKADLLPQVLHHLNVLEARAAGRALTAGFHRGKSELLQLAGEILFDAGLHDDAIAVYGQAAAAAREADAFDQWACALTRCAILYQTEGLLTDANQLVRAASTIARRGDPELTTRHWAASTAAGIAAAAHDDYTCRMALDVAAGAADLADPTPIVGWLRFNGSRIAEQQGSCMLSLGLFSEAASLLEEAGSAASSPRRQAAVDVERARIAVHDGDFAGAGTLVTAVAELVHRTGSNYVTSLLVPLAADLSVHTGVPEASELTETIATIKTMRDI